MLLADEWGTERTCREVNSSALTCEELHYTSITSLSHSFSSPPPGKRRAVKNIIATNWPRALIQSQACTEIHHTVISGVQQKFCGADSGRNLVAFQSTLQFTLRFDLKAAIASTNAILHRAGDRLTAYQRCRSLDLYDQL